MNNCKYCNLDMDWDGRCFLACSLCDDKWIVEVEQCPKEEIEG